MLLLCAGMGSCAVSAHADGFRHHGYHGGYYRNNWVAPAIIGGVIGYELSRPRYEPYYYPPVVVQQPPVYVQQSPVYVQQGQSCTAWTEVQSADGTITRTRTCQQ